MTQLDSAAFDALFDTFVATVVRLEALPLYSVGGAEQERIDAWKAGRPRPERSVRTSPWLARIAATTTTAGKRWSRVRVVDEPLTDYQRYQLDGYRESQAVGDQVSIARRGAVDDSGDDFWLFDARTPAAHAVLMRYHPDGSLRGRELVDDPATLAVLTARVERVATAAVPLNVFLADVTVVGG